MHNINSNEANAPYGVISANLSNIVLTGILGANVQYNEWEAVRIPTRQNLKEAVSRDF